MVNTEKKILIVDDDEMIAEFIRKMMQGHGYSHVKAFCNPMEAKGCLLQEDMDVLITDLDMPDVTGFDLIEIALKKNIRDIVVITGNPEAKDKLMDKSIENKVVLVSKPFHFDQLLIALSSY